VRFEDTLNGFHYYGKAIVKKGSESAALLATLDDRKHNGVLFTTKDDNFGLLPNVTLHIYNNKLLAELNAHQQAVFRSQLISLVATFRQICHRESIM
jgi:hypothetical protein